MPECWSRPSTWASYSKRRNVADEASRDFITFTATAAMASGQAKGTLTVNQAGVTKTTALVATVLKPATLVMTPEKASFVATVGQSSSPVTFYVGNSGDIDTSIPSVTITGAAAADFTQTNDCASALLAGAKSKCSVVVIYTPKAAATNAQATLTVKDSGGTASVSATLTGTATPPAPPSSLSITGTTTDLGTAVVGSVGTAVAFTVKNMVAAGGENSGAIKVSASPSQFVIATDGCSDQDLAPQATCTFTVQLKPAQGDVGVLQGQLKATGANVANPAFLQVTGTAVPAARLAINPKILEFGAIPTLQE